MQHGLSFKRLSLTQQVMTLILLMLTFLTVFFIFFLSDNITDTIAQQIYSLMSYSEQPVIRAMESGYTDTFESTFFEYLSSDPCQETGVIYQGKNYLVTRSELDYPVSVENYMSAQAESMLDHPEEYTIENTMRLDGTVYYFRMVRMNTRVGPSVVYSYMDSTYANELRTSLLDSTIYVTILAFFLILMIFVFWVFSIIHPLNQIRNYISQIKQGKDVELYINRDDEIGEVAKELRTLTTELAKQEKSKEEMIHNISHDLKTPIATIKSYSESIKDGIYPYGDLESSIDVILNNATRLEDKVHSLLYMNRIEYLVSSDSEGVVTNMKDVIEDVVLNSKVIKPEIQIITEIEEVFFDGLFESWRVCVENIMQNAFRYAKSYIKITVRENELLISNDGPKMPEDRIESLFKPYVKGEGGKFGLGLSIVSRVMAANGYKVEGLNTEDGVCFRIWRDVPVQKQSKFNISSGRTTRSKSSSSKKQNDSKKQPDSRKSS